MMTRNEFDDLLGDLDLTQAEAGRLLTVSDRTVRRWAENPEEIPGPAEQALRAWQRLKRFHLPWRPGNMPLGGDDDGLVAMINRYRSQSIDIPAVLERVEARGGPSTAWKVDIDAGKATLGLMTVYFYECSSGFAPNSYERMDGRDLDTERDCQFLDDAYACIDAALSRRSQERQSRLTR